MKNKAIFPVLFIALFVITASVQAEKDFTHHIIIANYSGVDETGWIDVGYEFTCLSVFNRFALGGAGVALDIKGDFGQAEIGTVVPLLTVPIANFSLTNDTVTNDKGWFSLGVSVAFDPGKEWNRVLFFGFRASWR